MIETRGIEHEPVVERRAFELAEIRPRVAAVELSQIVPSAPPAPELLAVLRIDAEAHEVDGLLQLRRAAGVVAHEERAVLRPRVRAPAGSSGDRRREIRARDVRDDAPRTAGVIRDQEVIAVPREERVRLIERATPYVYATGVSVSARRACARR
jgi:hypothetical protein